MLELGKKLVTELGLDNSVETLSRWMAHHIAELIRNVESASGPDRPAREKECRDAILDLWKHRHEFPRGHRPFEDFEPIFRALNSLDPDNQMPRYFRTPPGDQEQENAECRAWIELIGGLDYSARALIGYCLDQAAEIASPKVRDWISLAKGEAEAGADIAVMRRLITSADALHSKPDDSERKLLEDRVKRIETFVRMSSFLVQELRRKLDEDRPSTSKNLV